MVAWFKNNAIRGDRRNRSVLRAMFNPKRRGMVIAKRFGRVLR